MSTLVGASRRRTACTHLTPAGRGTSAEAPIDDPPSAGAEVPGRADRTATSEAVEKSLPVAILATAADVAGEWGGSGEERAEENSERGEVRSERAEVRSELGATASPTAAAAASEAEEATAQAGGADAAAVGDDAATSVAQSSVEERDTPSPSTTSVPAGRESAMAATAEECGADVATG